MNPEGVDVPFAKPRKNELLWIPARECGIMKWDFVDAPFRWKFSSPESIGVDLLLRRHEDLLLFWRYLDGQLSSIPYARQFYEKAVREGASYTQHSLSSIDDAIELIESYGVMHRDCLKIGRIRTRAEIASEKSEKNGPKLIIDEVGQPHLRFGGGFHRFLVAHHCNAWIPFSLEYCHVGADYTVRRFRRRAPKLIV